MGQGRDTTGQHTGRLVSVDEAARALGLSVDAVRKRIQRGTIAHEKDAAGRVRIILDGSETLRDDVRDSAGPNPEVLAARLEGLQDQLEMLREMLAEEREARRRADTVLAQLSQANAE